MNSDWMDENKFTLAKHGILAIMGGLVRVLVKGGPQTFLKFVAGAFVALFVGFLISFMCEYKKLDPNLTKVLIMLGSYSSVPLLDFLASHTRKILRKLFEPETKT